MKITIEVEVERVEGRNLGAAEVGEHICAQLIRRGELDGRVWVAATRGTDGSEYQIISAHAVTGKAPA